MTLTARQLSKLGTILAWSVFAILCAAVILFIWVGVRGSIAFSHLSSIQSGAASIATDVSTDPGKAETKLTRLSQDAEQAHLLTSDPAWKIAEAAPWIGPQLSAFSSVAEAADSVIGDSLLPLVTAAADLRIDSLKPVDGWIDTRPLASLTEPARSAAANASRASEALNGVDRTPLLGVVDNAVVRASDLFANVANGLDALARSSQLLPSMLGEGEHKYLLLVQNNAEWRSLGGLTGTAVLVTAENGRLSIGTAQSATSIARGLDEPVLPIADDVADIYGTRAGRYFHNLTLIPDFPFDGEMAQAMYSRATGIKVDGVIATDPVALSYLLRAVGPVSMSTGDKLTSESAVPLLLNEVYMRYSDPAQQDAFFASATGAVFEALFSGRGSVGSLLTSLSQAGAEHRILAWSADPDQQSLIQGTELAGELPTSSERVARFGVFLNDGTGSKMSYYIEPGVSLDAGPCTAADNKIARTLTLSLDLTSDAPADAGAILPTYITGGGAFGVQPGTARVIANIYLPQGFDEVSFSSGPTIATSRGTHDGRAVISVTTDLVPGASSHVEIGVRAISAVSAVEASVTPTADGSSPPVVRQRCSVGVGNPAGSLS